MTREEILNGLSFLRNSVESDEDYEIFDTAIKIIEQEPKVKKVIKMRDAIPEERESIDKYIKSISATTGVEFFDLEPCEDAISREELKKWLDMNFSFGGASRKIELFDRLDKELPPVTPTQRWIPVIEKLPKESEYVGNVRKYYLVQDEYGDMHVAHYSKIGWIPIHSLKALGDEVVAWMSLPKPYEAEMESDG